MTLIGIWSTNLNSLISHIHAVSTKSLVLTSVLFCCNNSPHIIRGHWYTNYVPKKITLNFRQTKTEGKTLNFGWRESLKLPTLLQSDENSMHPLLGILVSIFTKTFQAYPSKINLIFSCIFHSLPSQNPRKQTEKKHVYKHLKSKQNLIHHTSAGTHVNSSFPSSF